MSRRSTTSQVIGIWAEAQRAHQRDEALRQREAARREAAHAREAARDRREQQAAYRQYREAEARRRTAELETRLAELTGLLAGADRLPPFRLGALTRPEHVEPFAPGDLGRPVPMPSQEQFPPQTGWAMSAARRERAEREAYERFTLAWHAAQDAEGERLRALDAYRREYEEWAAGQLAEVRRHNEGLAETARGLRAGDPDAVVEYFTAALYASPAWPRELPRAVSAGYEPGPRRLVLDWELPGFAVVPEVKSVRYQPSLDQDKETPLPATRRRAAHRELIAQSVLLVLREVFAADEFGAVESVVVNGFVDDHDPATGRRAEIVLASVTASRSAFEVLRLAQVSAVDCLGDALGGRLSARPDQLAAVAPGRRPDEVGHVVTHGDGPGGAAGEDGEGPDLFTMDPLAFEELVAELFRAMGMRAVTTVRSGDGGVDVEAEDPTPIRGGRIVVQVKRYRNTVPPTAVRDLYGTVQDKGANKGVLVATSGFGPGSYAFAEGKPLELLPGDRLVELLREHGLRGRLGDRPGGGGSGGTGGGAPAVDPAAPTVVMPSPAPPPAAAPTLVDTSFGAPSPAVPPRPRQAPASAPAPAAEGPERNVLGLSWSGPVPLDVCALVCTGSRVLDESWFVFFNNPSTPDGSVRSRAHVPPDRAALDVAFEALPAGADRLVLVAAVDEERAPAGSDLTGFTRARIRLLDEGGSELGELEVSDGRAGETALVLGSFRRRANGDWDFVAGGRGYRDGLAALLADHGVDVA
ncbi:restriction endonuclease [Streptomyces sp. BI20]|uniref:restriction endonuclease n=1 Tax=Streptomyces sp. BI20 TaxID=3403460 RepID=UPI003C7832CC